MSAQLITEYQVVVESTKSKLEEEVSFLIESKWQPLGGIQIYKIGNLSSNMYQAMVRYGE